MPRGVKFGEKSWPNPGRSQQSLSHAPIPTPVTQNPSTRWVHALGNDVNCSTAFADGKFFVLDDSGTLFAFNGETGGIEWFYDTGESDDHDGGPCVYDDKVIIGGTTVHAVNISDGSQAWTFTTSEAVEGNIVAANQRIFVPTDANVVATLYALNPDGTEDWSYSASGDERAVAVEGGQVFFSDRQEQDAVAVSEDDGSENWSVDMGDATGAAADGQRVYFGLDSGEIRALDPSDGSQDWNVSPFGGTNVLFKPAVAGGLVYVVDTNAGNIEARDISDGAQDWNSTNGSAGVAAPTVAGDHVYYQNDNGLRAMNRVTGANVWTHDISGGQTVTTNIITMPGRIYTVGQDGSAYCIVEG